jgi:hypothetical protein
VLVLGVLLGVLLLLCVAGLIWQLLCIEEYVTYSCEQTLHMAVRVAAEGTAVAADEIIQPSCTCCFTESCPKGCAGSRCARMT